MEKFRPDAPPIPNPARRLLAGINRRIKDTIAQRDADIAAIEAAHRVRPNSGVMAQMRGQVHAAYDKVMDGLNLMQSQIEPLADEVDLLLAPRIPDAINTTSLIDTLGSLDVLTLARIVAELGASTPDSPYCKVVEQMGRDRAAALGGSSTKFDTLVDELVNDSNAFRQHEGSWMAAQI